MQMFRFKPTAKFRIVSNAVSFYTTARAIRSGIGDSEQFNAATQLALDSLEYQRSTCNIPDACVGISGAWRGVHIQIDVK